jgi:hypothetical protein
VRNRRRHPVRGGAAVLLLIWAMAAAGCFVRQASAPTLVATSDGSSVSFESDLAFCVGEINRYRALANRSVLARSAALEAYAAAAARTDGLGRAAHRHAQDTGFGGGLVRAENEIPFWPLSQYRSVRAIVEGGLAQMYAQGPAGGHYRNMMGDHTEVGCGIFLNGDEVTVVQAFR